MKPATSKKILLISAFVSAGIFLPTTILLAFTMLPFVVAYIVDRAPSRNSSFCVGTMNFAGALPFLLELWGTNNSISGVFEILRHPKTIVIVYSIAMCGYIIDATISDIVAKIMIQKAKSRVRDVEKRQTELRERWGDTVNGQTPLDDYGFPL